MDKLLFNSVLSGPSAYEDFKKLALQFYDSGIYRFVSLELAEQPTLDNVKFKAEFWSVKDSYRKYGQWKRIKNWMKSVCSNCSFESEEESNFCPHCGAEMKASGKE